MEIKVDPELCIGSGNCVHMAPGVFELDEADVAAVVDPNAAPAEDIRKAERSCPTAAISVEEDEQ
jgi:ferredoxin